MSNQTSPTTTDCNRPISERDAAEFSNHSVAAYRKWRREGRGPAYLKVGRTIRYLPSDLEAWLNEHRVGR